MSLHVNAPYQDQNREDGSFLIYKWLDEPRKNNQRNPTIVDHPEFCPSCKRTEHGKFNKAAQAYKTGLKRDPDIVRVYEKIIKGIWLDNGYFHRVDSWVESDGIRNVFKFKLVAVETVFSDEEPEDTQECAV